MRIAYDMSSVIWTCLLAGEDKEGYSVDFEGKSVKVNSAAYGYENAVNSMLASMKMANCQPRQMILVVEGLNSKSRRLACSPDYKAKRGDRPQEAYAEFHKVKEALCKAFGSLGALVVEQEEAEADDVMGWLAEHSEEDLVVISRDGDMSVLNGTNAQGATITVINNGVVGENPYGDFPHKYVSVYKALVGDSRDNISGIKGFGDVAFKSFLAEFGVEGLADLARMAELGTLNELAPKMDNKLISKIVYGETDFLRSYTLAKLHPEWVNTMRYPLKFSPGLIKGEVTDERLQDYAPGTDLVTADNWAKFITVFRQVIRDQLANGYPDVAFDIETSTPDESDAWLAAQDNPDGVDVMGSELTGLSFTCGMNSQHTFYISVNHANTPNVAKASIGALLREMESMGVKFIIQNYSFEGTVIFNEFKELFADNNNQGLLSNVYDTKLEASYVNENESLGLKKLSAMYFNYAQVDYKTVTTIDGVPHKMCELTAAHVKDYGCDDTICTISLHNFFKLFMQLEHTWSVYEMVEIDAMYQHTQNFINGFRCDVAKCKELEAIDDATFEAAQTVVHGYLISKGWAGTTCPTVKSAEDLTPALIKDMYFIVHEQPLETSVRKLEKLLEAVADKPLFHAALSAAIAGNYTSLNSLVALHFKAKPEFNPGSPKQMQNLLYETMGMQMRVFNKPTPVMLSKGLKQGTPKTDALAIAYAKAMDATEEQKALLESLRLMKMVETRRGLYYSTYPYFVHWKTKRIHSSHNQCATNTRRASSSAPNMQQMPKNQKIEGQPARFREVVIPHKRNAVVVSMDFAAQELRIIADYSKDPNMVACYVGDKKLDMHLMTGLGIAKRKMPEFGWTYELAEKALHDSSDVNHKFIKKCRSDGKNVNFGTEFGAMAPKVATMMLISEEDAQAYIDAKLSAFPEVSVWKEQVVLEAKTVGYVRSKLGAVRHLRDALLSSDKSERSKAERQAVNFKVQGSAAEMTKLAESRMWREKLTEKYDAKIYGPIHDEVVCSVAIDQLEEFLPKMHKCMVEPYADMQIPIESSISMGVSFGQQIEIGSLPVKEAVRLGLRELQVSLT